MSTHHSTCRAHPVEYPTRLRGVTAASLRRGWAMRQGPTMCLIAGHGYLVPADLQVVADMSRPDSVGELRRFSPGRFRLEEAPVMTPTPGDELMTVHGV